MLEYLDDNTVTCGSILLICGGDKANRLWVYRNDLGEEYPSGAKSECRRKAIYDLRLCRIDLVVEYTASGGIHRFDYSDTFQQKNINDVAEKLKTARMRENRYKNLYEEACKERDHFKNMLKTIEKFIKEK